MLDTLTNEPGEIFGELFSLADIVRRAQGDALDVVGFGPQECSYRLIASGPQWQLRDYGGDSLRSPLLIVAAPIKRPYIWDLTPSLSAVGTCLRNRRRVFLLEWKPPTVGNVGLDIYADQAIAQCLAAISDDTGHRRSFLLGHSLGGTLAATFAALESQSILGLVLLSSPVSFQPGSSGFRDAIVGYASRLLPKSGIIPGTVLSQLSVIASPDTFIWSRLLDAALSLADTRAMQMHARVERWALDEAPLPGRLVRELMLWFYEEDRLCQGTLWLRGRTVCPRQVRVPTLAVVDTADDVAPRASVQPFLDAISTRDVGLIEFPGELGVGLQHLAVLVGPRTHPLVWRQIITWFDAHDEPPG
jgi:polyhydroxyalkanoate synthase